MDQLTPPTVPADYPYIVPLLVFIVIVLVSAFGLTLRYISKQHAEQLGQEKAAREKSDKERDAAIAERESIAKHLMEVVQAKAKEDVDAARAANTAQEQRHDRLRSEQRKLYEEAETKRDASRDKLIGVVADSAANTQAKFDKLDQRAEKFEGRIVGELDSISKHIDDLGSRVRLIEEGKSSNGKIH